MDEVVKRLKETSENCIQSYEAWTQKSSDDTIREELQAHIHELRKVASRLEIEIAMSERDQMKSKRIPIPPHRSSKQNGKGDHGQNDSIANDDGTPVVKKTARRRKPKAAQGEE